MNKTLILPQELCIHELFAAQAQRTPDAVALIFGNQEMTYRQVDQRANQLAHLLIDQGVTIESLVAISLHRSFEMFIGILGIQKAGAAYVPIDPAMPAERFTFIFSDTRTQVCLTQTSLKNKFTIHSGINFICLDQWEPIAAFPTMAPDIAVTPENLSYTIYTSGSTGKPKGVQVEHRSVRNLIQAQINYVQHPVKRFLYAYSFAFDGAVLLIYWTLLDGGTLVIAPENLEKDISNLASFIYNQQISHLLTFPSLYNLLLNEVQPKHLNTLESVSVAGEACPAALVSRHHSIFVDTKLFNQFGPTEATVGCSIFTTTPDFNGDKVPIGKAIENTFLYVLNEQLQPVEAGETGEIFIGGAGVARGYLNRPELTARKFIKNPFGPAGNIYATGDLGRWLPDGNLDFMGRKDHQIKLRGYRIELGEVEAKINGLPAVLDTAVLLKGDNSETQKLVAYLVLKNGASLTIRQLRDQLSKKLPAYMLPAAMVVLDKMPLTTAGKIDRKALPELSRERPVLETNYEAPQTALEKYLTNLWQEILEIDQIGIHDRFFELGGNSLQAAQFINKIQEKIGETIFIVTIFTAPSISQYAQMLVSQYSEAIARIFTQKNKIEKSTGAIKKLTRADFANFQTIIPKLPISKTEETTQKNKRAIFILAPPRSGTSLLRIMLAGHPGIFAANELQLLGFQNLQQRATAYSDKFALWKEGLVRTVMELENASAETAKSIIQKAEENATSTQSFYQYLQNKIRGQILVDKSPSYALDPAILAKAESDFTDPIYIQLVRHPYAMVRSFEKMRMSQVMYLEDHNFQPRQVGELIWTESHRVINEFFAKVENHRKFRISYEDLVTDPQRVMENFCKKTGIPFDESLIRPYRNIDLKMTDGIYDDSKPMGDVNLLEHGKIIADLAKKSEGVVNDNFLSDATWQTAQQLGYQNPSEIKGDENNRVEQPLDDSIAIIGMAVRLPGAKNITEFWDNLKAGRDVSKVFTNEELIAAGVSPEIFNDPDYVRRGMPLENADCFDATFFGYHPKEAALMDPQHRIYLQTAYAALQDAGIDPENHEQRIGVFGGIARNTYLVNNVITHPNYFKSVDDFQLGITLEKDFPATRVAYKLNLKGPAINIQTACSSSGVALHLACQSIRNGDCEVAIVGGGRIQPPFAGHLHKEGHALSPDGYCRTFDADANGMVRGNGMSFIIIKKLKTAIEDQDQVHGLIRATAINNDGQDKVGFTAPGITGQSTAIMNAYRRAEIDPNTISYIECHGTGTPIGDPVELAGLTTAFSAFTDRKQFCAVGSVKTNVGHLDAGACITGIIKTLLSLKHEQLPASLHYNNPNPQINFKDSPFYVNDKLTDWKRGAQPRRAGVSSFGLGGTNAHIVLEEAPVIKRKSRARSQQLITLSAKTSEALSEMEIDLLDFLKRNPEESIGSLAATLQLGRSDFKCRTSLVGESITELINVLEERDPVRLFSQSVEVPKKVVFMFPGGGSQYTNMGKDLYREEAVFRQTVNECLTLLKNEYQLDFKNTLYPDHDRLEPILDPLAGITLLFTVEYATAKLLMSWGIQPAAMIGHSLGEYTAATLSGLMSLEAAMGMVATRGKLFLELEEGGMLSIGMTPEALEPYLTKEIDYAAINKPNQVVVSGSATAIDQLKKKLTTAEIHATRPHIKVAAHSQMIDPILPAFEKYLKTVEFGELAIPVMSNICGNWMQSTEASKPEYWLSHLRQTVNFSDGIRHMLSMENTILLEVGPGQTLSTFARQHPDRKPETAIFASLKHPKETIDDQAFLLKNIGRLWLSGVTINWKSFNQYYPLPKISLPTYPFAKQRHWLNAKSLSGTSEIASYPAINSILETNIKTQLNQAQMERKDLLSEKIKDIFHELSGIPITQMDIHASFLELGFDSLFLTQATSKIKKAFKIKLSFRQLFEEAPNIDTLAKYVDNQLAPDALKAELAERNTTQNSPATATNLLQNNFESAPMVIAPDFPAVNPLPSNAVTSGIESLLQQQLNLMQQQLNLLSGQKNTGTVQQVSTPQVSQETNSDIVNKKNLPPKSKIVTTPKKEKSEGMAFGPWAPLDKRSRADLTEREIKYLDELIHNYTTKTKGSQELTNRQRPYLADPRAISGFTTLWKDMIYQIAVERSKGAKFWDVDGNEYVDYRSAFGISLFGHTPDFIQEAISKQLEKGIELGVLTPLAEKVAKLLCEITGCERSTLVNTGSEAISAAIRVARTVTDKDRLIVFSGDYHGIIDEMLVKGINRNGKVVPVPIAPGIPHWAVDQVIVLDYDDPEVLEKIRTHADEVAAVIIEPVQPNNPHVQRGPLFHEIRKLCTKHEMAMIFDEMITGFRVAPGGAQEWFDIEVDIVAYGKILSGGLPMAAVAGKRKFMDAFDGGAWNYGDDSVPEVGVTFFGGTFVKHPLSLASALAALTEIKRLGQPMYDELNAKTARFAERLRTLFLTTKVPLQVLSCASVVTIKLLQENPLGKLFFFYLRMKGVHLMEKAGLISTAHTQEDLDFTYDTIVETIREMQTAGFFPLTVAEDAPDTNVIVYPPNRCAQSQKEMADLGVRMNEKKKSPLTEGQKEVWVEQRLSDGAAAAYNLSSNIRLAGPLQITDLQRALTLLVDRHEALRATYDLNNTHLIIHDKVEQVFPLIDLSHLSIVEKEQAFQSYLDIEAEQPLDIFTGPLFRATIIRLEPNLHHLLMTAHHGVADGYSCGVLISDLAKLYQQVVSGNTLNLPAPKQISDYLSEQDQYRTSDEYQEAEAYWVEQFSASIPVLDFPTDRLRPAQKTYGASCEKISIDQQLFSALKQLSIKEGTTLFVTMYTAFHTFIHRLSGQFDFVLGMVAAGQSNPGNEDLITHAVSLLPVRIKVAEGVNFSNHLKTARGKILDAFEYQNYTLGSLVKRLNIPRDLSRQPIISILFNMDSAMGDLKFGNLETEMNPIVRNYETFDIFINVKPTSDGVDFEWIYNTDLFDAETIKRRLESFRLLLENIVQQPQLPISQINLLPEKEKNTILNWVKNQTVYPDQETITSLFEAQTLKTPNTIAVESQDKTMTYQQLNEDANHLAHHLLRAGVKKGDFVGVFVTRSVELLISLLAILKTGGIYVPLDPANPKDRLAVILEDAQAKILLTQNEMLAQVPEGDHQVITLESIYKEHKNGTIRNLDVGLTSNDLAYIIYTSGSTGKPKGILIPHNAVVDHHYAMMESAELTAADVTLSVASVSFDPSVQDFFLPLFLGGKVVIASDAEVLDGFLLKERLDRSGINFMQATPATWRMLMTAGWHGHSKMRMMSIGEALTKELAQQLLARGKDLYNAYGPSETTIYTTVKKLTGDRLATRMETGYETIGYPMKNAQVYILDPQQIPVPIGVPGEVYVGGVGVAPTGYYKRPELNKEKFVVNPLNETEMVYRTGDIARWLPDGDIDFIGRVDHQVKVRGFRIELGEIESLLSQYLGVRQNVVMVREDQPDNKRIVAYLIMDGDLKQGELRRYLKEKLPDYMVPSTFVKMDKFPLTGTLKINRKLLPEPDYTRDEEMSGFVAAQTESEKKLTAIWSKSLGIKEIGIHDNFFELGGHSLIAVTMMAEIGKQFDRTLPLSKLMENSTIHSLAGLLEQDQVYMEYQTLVAIQPNGNKVPVYLVHGAGLHVFLFQALKKHLDEDQPVYGIQALGLQNDMDPLETIEEMAAFYISEILAQNPDGPYALVGYSFGGLVVFEMAQQLRAMGKEVSMLGMLDTVVRGHLAVTDETVNQGGLLRSGKKIAWNLGLLVRDPVESFKYKSEVFRRQLKRWTYKNGPGGKIEKTTNEERLARVDQMNHQAYNKYRMRPYDGTIHLFRAKEQRFYLDDFEFLGWKPFAKKGIVIREVPGDHRTILYPENGEQLARILQTCLDELHR